MVQYAPRAGSTGHSKGTSMNRKHILRTGMAIAALSTLALTSVACSSGDDDDPTPTTAATSAAATSANTAVASTATRAATTLAPTTAAAAKRVAVQDNAFSPAALTVASGTTVTWNFAGAAAPHSVVGKFDGQDVKSPTNTGSGTFQFTFSKAGTFDYQCGVHGPSMSGKVTVS